MGGQGIPQAMTVEGEILIVQERGGAIDAPMGDMKRDAGQLESRATWHGNNNEWAGHEHACGPLPRL